MGTQVNTNLSFISQSVNRIFPSGYGFLRDTLGLDEMAIEVGVVGVTTLAIASMGAYCCSQTVRSLVNRCVFAQPSTERSESMSKVDHRKSMEVRAPSTSEEKLYEACCKKNVKVKDILPLLKEADLDQIVRGETSLHALCRNGHNLLVDLFLSQGADPTIRGKEGQIAFALLPQDQLNQRFLEACLGDEEEMAQLVLDCGAEVNIRDRSQNTPLHYACAKGFKGLVESLLNQGAKPGVLNASGETPFHCAILFDRTEIEDLLQERGATGEGGLLDFVEEEQDPSERMDHPASNCGSEEKAELERLQKRYKFPVGSDVDAENDGKTLLRAACGNGNVEDVLKLLALGANSRRLDGKGRRCFDFLSGSALYDLFKKRHRGEVPRQWMRTVGGSE